MTTITKEQAELKSFITGFLSDPAHDNQSSNSLTAEVFRIALASLTAEPVLYAAEETLAYANMGELHLTCLSEPMGDAVIPLYAAPPAQVSVPDEMPCGGAENDYQDGYQDGWNACRAAMLQGKAEPVSNRDELPPSIKPAPELDFVAKNAKLLPSKYPVIPDEVLSAIRKVARIRTDFNHFDGDRRGIADCLDEAEQELIVTINEHAAMLQGADGNSPVIQDGYALVPIVPTEEMIINGFESEPDPHFSDEKEWEEYEALSGCQQAAHRARLCWEAMIAAASQQDGK